MRARNEDRDGGIQRGRIEESILDERRNSGHKSVTQPSPFVRPRCSHVLWMCEYH